MRERSGEVVTVLAAMRMLGLCVLVLLSAPVLVEVSADDVPPVVIDYFYEEGCPDCLRVRSQVLPGLKERFEGFYVLKGRLTAVGNYNVHGNRTAEAVI